jgi:hypothetical protein
MSDDADPEGDIPVAPRLWYVHRRDDNAIASRHEEPQAGYAEEALAEDAEEMVAWMAEHGVPAAGVAMVPQRVTSGSFVRALYELGQLDAVEAAIAGALQQGNRLPDLLFRHASQFERDHALVAAIGAAAGLKPADIDAVFVKAATYDV